MSAVDKMPPYKDIIPGKGSGKVKVGEIMEMRENLYSLLFVSLFRQEYIDACNIVEYAE